MKNYKYILEAIDRGIQLALDDYDDNVESSKKLGGYKEISSTKEYLDLMNEVVDLSLPSKTLWCKYNLGVNPNQLFKPEDWYGDYYAWGETIPNKPDGYNWETYQFKKDLIKYNTEDHLTELQLIDDTAYQNMHLYNFKFKMPTKEQFDELIEETNIEWVEDFNNSGVNGYKFTNKLDSSKYIFLPTAGYCISSDLRDVGWDGKYWSSSLYSDYPHFAWYLYFNNEGVDMNTDDRYSGFSVRPVINL